VTPCQRANPSESRKPVLGMARALVCHNEAQRTEARMNLNLLFATMAIEAAMFLYSMVRA